MKYLVAALFLINVVYFAYESNVDRPHDFYPDVPALVSDANVIHLELAKNKS